jgi:hypothetical protein
MPLCAPEGLNEWLMSQPVYVLHVVVGLVGSLYLALGFTRVDALQNAQPPAKDAKQMDTYEQKEAEI